MSLLAHEGPELAPVDVEKSATSADNSTPVRYDPVGSPVPCRWKAMSRSFS